MMIPALLPTNANWRARWGAAWLKSVWLWSMHVPLKLCLSSYIALSVLLPLWYAWWFPAYAPLVVASVLLLAGWLMWAIARNGRLTYAGMVVFLLFIHGVTEAMVLPAQRVPALLTVGLSLLYFSGMWLQIRQWRAAGVRPRKRGS
jgi:uncharacterized membrane protein